MLRLASSTSTANSASALLPTTRLTARQGRSPLAGKAAVKASTQGSSQALGTQTEPAGAAKVKVQLSQALQGVNRGIFGIQASKRAIILDLLNDLEQLSPEPEPAQNLETVDGCWRLLYSTIRIQGVKKTRLGLREVVSLGDFLQIIDTSAATAVNQVCFSLNLFGKLPGKLTINATYKAVGDCRVEVAFADAKLEPRQLQELFASQLDVLLSIFNPEGWLDITYVDQTHRIGRDQKGNIFYLERCLEIRSSGRQNVCFLSMDLARCVLTIDIPDILQWQCQHPLFIIRTSYIR